MNFTEIKDVVLIGGGITGLSAAWYLQNAGLSVSLIEANACLGGKVQTERSGDFVMEAGADAFLKTKPAALDLIRDLDLQEETLTVTEHNRKVYVLKNGRLVAFPKGVRLVVPTDFAEFARTPLVSLGGKMRAMSDLAIRSKPSVSDTSVGDFVERRLGREMVSAFAEPLMSGIYSADPYEQSMRATFPQFLDAEAKKGSLIRSFRGRKSTGESPFLTFRGGMGRLVERLEERLTCEVLLNTSVTAIKPDLEGYRVCFGADSLLARSVVLAVSVGVAAELVGDFAPDSAEIMQTLRTTQTGILTLGFHKKDVPTPLNATGVVIPRTEKRHINALTWSSSKFEGRAPDDSVLIRAFWGGARTPHMMEKSDAEVLDLVRGELEDILGIGAGPLVMPTLTRIHRWTQPQYDVGHLDRVTQIENSLPQNLYVTGCAYRGVGIPDCIRQGRETAAKILENRRVYT